MKFWSVHDRILKNFPYTNNSCEAYNRYLNSHLKKKNQELGKIIDIFKKEEQRVSLIINDLKHGKLIPRKRNTLINIIHNYDFYNDYEFFECLSYELNLYFK